MRANGRGLLGRLAILTIVIGLLPLGLGAAIPGALPCAYAEEQGDMPPVAPEDVVDQGTCGESVEWSLDRFGVLRITGEGAISFEGTTAPWNVSHEDDIRFVIVGEGITHFPGFCFTSPDIKAIFFTGPFVPGYEKYFSSNTFITFEGTGYFRKGDTTWDDAFLVGSQSPKAYPPGMTTVDWSEVEDIGVCGEDAFWTYGNGTLTIKGSGAVDSSGWYDHRESVASIVVEEGIMSIEDFSNFPELTSVLLSSTIVEMGEGAFRGCEKLAELTLPAGLKSLPADSFHGCSALGSVTFGESLVSIGSNAFYDCFSLEGVELPSGLKTIGEDAFRNCGELTTIEIPGSLESIGSGAFSGCAQLNRIDFLGALPQISSDAFRDVTASVVHHQGGEDWDGLNKANDFGGNLTWYGVAEDGSLVEDSYVCPGYYDPIELAPSTWDTQSNYPTEYVAWHFTVPEDQSVKLAYSYDYDEGCTHHMGSLRLMSTVGNEGNELWLEVFSPVLTENGEIYYKTFTLEAGDYYLLGSLDNTHGNAYSSFSVKFTLEGKGGSPTPSGSQPMYRCYNPWTGEHFYTASGEEYYNLCFAPGGGWNAEGVGWTAPASGAPVYRLYNPFAEGGDHHYTLSWDECVHLTSLGWHYEGIGWYSASDSMGNPKPGAKPLYRQYNPYARTGTHNYTASKEENDHLVSVGWREEGIGWYGL